MKPAEQNLTAEFSFSKIHLNQQTNKNIGVFFSDSVHTGTVFSRETLPILVTRNAQHTSPFLCTRNRFSCSLHLKNTSMQYLTAQLTFKHGSIKSSGAFGLFTVDYLSTREQFIYNATSLLQGVNCDFEGKKTNKEQIYKQYTSCKLFSASPAQKHFFLQFT